MHTHAYLQGPWHEEHGCYIGTHCAVDSVIREWKVLVNGVFVLLRFLDHSIKI